MRQKLADQILEKSFWEEFSYPEPELVAAAADVVVEHEGGVDVATAPASSVAAELAPEAVADASETDELAPTVAVDGKTVAEIDVVVVL